MADKLPEPEIVRPEIVVDPEVPSGEVHLKQDGEVVGKIVDVGPTPIALKGDPFRALDTAPMLDDQRTEEQDIELRRDALKLMQVALPSKGEVDDNYFRPTALGDPGEYLEGKSLKEHEPQSDLNEHLRKMFPKGWKAPPVQPPQAGDVEYLAFWDTYFAETGDVPTWTELEEYDAIRRRAFGSPQRGEKPKRRGFQVTGRFCRKPGCGGEVRHDPDSGIEQCFGCGEIAVVVDRRLARR